MNERDIYRQQNFGNRIGFGRRSALLIVDFTVGFNDPELFGGGNIDGAVKRSVELLAFSARRSCPWPSRGSSTPKTAPTPACSA
jgi:maleamate amidohydrolase